MITRQRLSHFGERAIVPHTHNLTTKHRTRLMLEKGLNMTNLNLNSTNLVLELARPVYFAGTTF